MMVEPLTEEEIEDLELFAKRRDDFGNLIHDDWSGNDMLCALATIRALQAELREREPVIDWQSIVKQYMGGAETEGLVRDLAVQAFGAAVDELSSRRREIAAEAIRRYRQMVILAHEPEDAVLLAVAAMEKP